MKEAKSILTPQNAGFLVQGPYPFTHTLSPYTGCAFGGTTCGLYCYAQWLPSWHYRDAAVKHDTWGDGVLVKGNAAGLLADYLKKAPAGQRRSLRIFCSTTTDPYQGPEAKHEITRHLLEVFSQYDDLDLLVIQTRSPLAERDIQLMRKIPYLWLSVTLETDDQEMLTELRGGPQVAKRLHLVRAAVEQGIKTQIAVSPMLPTRDPVAFASLLVEAGAHRYIVDTFKDGDGSGGARTERSRYAGLVEDWDDDAQAHELYRLLQDAGADVGWSAAGFCGIPYRNPEAAPKDPEPRQVQMWDLVDTEASMLTPDPTAITIVLGLPGERPRALPGFPFFWAKYVHGFDARYHCAQCLVGPFHKGFWSSCKIPARHVMSQAVAPYVYLCGVAETRWADNLHIAMESDPGAHFEITAYNGIPIRIWNARRLDIPWLEDGWNHFPKSYTTCRNFQFGVHSFGYDGETRLVQPEFTTSKRDRTKKTLERAEQLRVGRAKK